MAIADRDARGSIFSITFQADHHLDRFVIISKESLVPLVDADCNFLLCWKLALTDRCIIFFLTGNV